MATALPAATDFTGASVTEAQFKTAMTSMRTYLSDLLGADGVEATALAAIMAPFSAVNAQTIAYSVVASDRGKVIYYTGSGGVALTLPVTTTTDFGVGYGCSVVNLSTGTITLTRSSTDTVDGATTVALGAGSSTILFIAAAAKWVTIGKGPGAATATTSGIVELATTDEAATGTDTARAVTPAGLLEAKKLTYNDATVATNGTTSKAVTGIPSWARIIVVGYGGISSNQNSNFRLDLGDAGGYETGNSIITSATAGNSYDGSLVLVNITGNSWAYTSPTLGGFVQTTSATVDRLQLLTTAGAFDGGTLTVYWL